MASRQGFRNLASLENAPRWPDWAIALGQDQSSSRAIAQSWHEDK
jgi:hypothetical protein